MKRDRWKDENKLGVKILTWWKANFTRLKVFSESRLETVTRVNPSQSTEIHGIVGKKMLVIGGGEKLPNLNVPGQHRALKK